jgi:hypothetical protein
MRQVLVSALAGALTGALVCALSLGAGPLPWMTGRLFTPATASQNPLSSPTTGTVSGLQQTNNFNNALDSVNTANSGAAAPTNQLSGVPSAGNAWLGTSANPYPFNYYDGADWLTPFWLDTVNHLPIVQVGGGTASVASATTTDLCAGAPQYFLTITGTVTITSFGSSCVAGQEKAVKFAAALTLTYNATSLIIPGAANVVTAAGDVAKVLYLGGGNWLVESYTPASGGALINPAVDVGDYLFTAALSPPSAKYLFAYGQAISRTTYAAYLGVVTSTQSVSRTNGSPTLTGFSDTTQIANGGAAIEGAGIQTGATIVSCTSTTCTMSANATSSGTANVTVFPYGNGNGSTTFNMPNCQGVALVGRDNMSGSARGALTSTYFGVNPDALGAYGGTQSQALSSTNQLPQFTPSGTLAATLGICQNAAGGCANGSANLVTSGTQTANLNIFTLGSATFAGNSVGSASPTPFGNVQPSLTANCMVRVLAMHTPASDDDAPALPATLAANDNFAESRPPAPPANPPARDRFATERRFAA